MTKFIFADEALGKTYVSCIEIARRSDGTVVVLATSSAKSEEDVLVVDSNLLKEIEEEKPTQREYVGVDVLLPGAADGTDFENDFMQRGSLSDNLLRFAMMGGFCSGMFRFDDRETCHFFPILENHGLAVDDLVLVTLGQLRYAAVVKKFVDEETAKPYLTKKVNYYTISKLNIGERVSPAPPQRPQSEKDYRNHLCVQETPNGKVVIGTYLGATSDNRVIYEDTNGHVCAVPNADNKIAPDADFKIQPMTNVPPSIPVITLESFFQKPDGSTPTIVRIVVNFNDMTWIYREIGKNIFFCENMTLNGVWTIKNVECEPLRNCEGLYVAPSRGKIIAVSDTKRIHIVSDK